jgi:hypothetical protein
MKEIIEIFKKMSYFNHPPQSPYFSVGLRRFTCILVDFVFIFPRNERK